MCEVYGTLELLAVLGATGLVVMLGIAVLGYARWGALTAISWLTWVLLLIGQFAAVWPVGGVPHSAVASVTGVHGFNLGLASVLFARARKRFACQSIAKATRGSPDRSLHVSAGIAFACAIAFFIVRGVPMLQSNPDVARLTFKAGAGFLSRFVTDVFPMFAVGLSVSLSSLRHRGTTAGMTAFRVGFLVLLTLLIPWAGGFRSSVVYAALALIVAFAPMRIIDLRRWSRLGLLGVLAVLAALFLTATYGQTSRSTESDRAARIGEAARRLAERATVTGALGGTYLIDTVTEAEGYSYFEQTASDAKYVLSGLVPGMSSASSPLAQKLFENIHGQNPYALAMTISIYAYGYSELGYLGAFMFSWLLAIGIGTIGSWLRRACLQREAFSVGLFSYVGTYMVMYILDAPLAPKLYGTLGNAVLALGVYLSVRLCVRLVRVGWKTNGWAGSGSSRGTVRER